MTDKLAKYKNLTRTGLSESEWIAKKRAQYIRSSHYIYVCGTCEEEKPGSEFYFDKNYRNGRPLSKCKDCKNEETNKNRKERSARIKKAKAKSRAQYIKLSDKQFICPECDLVKYGREFPHDVTKENGINLNHCDTCRRKKVSQMKKKRREINNALLELQAPRKPKSRAKKKEKEE